MASLNTALLSARKRTATGDLRALIPLVGEPVIAWQISLAMQLGCTRIVVLCDAPSPEILELQHTVEDKGGEFHAIRTSLQLLTLLKPDEVLLMLLDGLVVDPQLAEIAVKDGETLRSSVFTLEAGSALTERYPAEFERIDATRCWAGLTTMRASHAQKLADLPPDGDTISLLLRIALQSRTETNPILLDEHEPIQWLLAADTEAVVERQETILDLAVPKSEWSGPTLAIASKLVRLSAGTGIANGPAICVITAVILAILSVGLVSYGNASIGLGVAALGAAVGSFGEISRDTKVTLFGAADHLNIFGYFNAVRDVFAIASLAFALTVQPVVLAALPIFVVGLLWLAAGNSTLRVAPFWNDRALHLAALAICTVYDVLSEGLVLLGLLALAQSTWRHFFAIDE
ncbi:hypothetical protein [Erythrobacter crassostreae]|uniref:MobA-like NTP transferase domain-containing protein n=1 Tax=Erythrobacter crassostreae TaxID=2828328 RepID=A0A9X1JLJ9_9SPHN|nr:hypothetical protein [Erythrobacter crassostrea]MBV7260230.1 hypothetical protein [Erythrobacter crassostrea]